MTEQPSGWITTYTGRRVYPLNLRPEDIDIVDIARALSMQCRFTGHVLAFYSVAQHSVLVSEHCDPKDALWGLLHDASEAYLCDVARPVKHSAEMASYRTAEALAQNAICERFGLPMVEPDSVRRTDKAILRTEQRDVTVATEWRQFDHLPIVIRPWSQREAERLFLARFEALGGVA